MHTHTHTYIHSYTHTLALDWDWKMGFQYHQFMRMIQKRGGEANDGKGAWKNGDETENWVFVSQKPSCGASVAASL